MLVYTAYAETVLPQVVGSAFAGISSALILTSDSIIARLRKVTVGIYVSTMAQDTAPGSQSYPYYVRLYTGSKTPQLVNVNYARPYPYDIDGQAAACSVPVIKTTQGGSSILVYGMPADQNVIDVGWQVPLNANMLNPPSPGKFSFMDDDFRPTLSHIGMFFGISAYSNTTATGLYITTLWEWEEYNKPTDQRGTVQGIDPSVVGIPLARQQ